jgi:hypothetical protein
MWRTLFGGPTGQTALFAAVGGVFATGTVVSSSVRGKEDMWNQAVGACAAGGVVGARFGSAQTAAIACPMFAFTSIMVDLSGKTFRPSREIMSVKHAEHVAPYDAEVKRATGH